MATSGTITYRINRDQIITQSLLLCSALDPENSAGPTANQTSNAATSLNLMVKAWESAGLQLWERKYAAIFPQLGQEVYVLGSPGPSGDHAVLSTPVGTGFIDTTLSAAAAKSATSITVTAANNASTIYATVGVPSISMSSGDNIGIQQTDGTMFWTTINGAPVGTTITLTTGLTVGANNLARVVTYTTKLMRPLRILDAFTRQSNGSDIPHLLIPRDIYNRFGVKSSKGTSIQTYYDPQENSGHVYTYPTCSDVTQTIFIEFQKPIEDFNASTDDFDLPQEWGEAIVWNLAVRLAPTYSVPRDKFNQLVQIAQAMYLQLDGWDQETGSVYIQPSQWSYMHDGITNSK